LSRIDNLPPHHDSDTRNTEVTEDTIRQALYTAEGAKRQVTVADLWHALSTRAPIQEVLRAADVDVVGVLYTLVHDDSAPAPRSPSTHLSVEFWNDDYTPMEFVVEILSSVFQVAPLEAHELMYRIHDKGSAVVYRGLAGDARERLARAETLSRTAGFPLRLTLSTTASE